MRIHGDKTQAEVILHVSVESAAAEVVGDDDVGDGVKHKLNVVGVGRTRLVAVDLFHRAAVLCLKLRLDERRSLLVRRWTCTKPRRCFNRLRLGASAANLRKQFLHV